MRIKKGFTLAEVLIVLMVIGAIATMTIPSLMKGVTETQWKTSYKKAYNAIINLTAMERIAGSLPSSADGKGVLKMFESLNSNLAVKDYVDQADAPIGAGTIATTAVYKTGVTYTDSNGNTVSTGSAGDQATLAADAETSPWITSDDNISYTVAAGEGCGTKQAIDSATTMADVLASSCVVVVIDVNGVAKGPNVVEPQQITELAADATMQTLTGDQYYVFVGRDGATPGSKKYTLSGRIIADLK